MGHKAQLESKEHSASQSSPQPAHSRAQYLPKKRQPGVRGGATAAAATVLAVTLGKSPS